MRLLRPAMTSATGIIVVVLIAGCSPVNGPEYHDPTNPVHLAQCLTTHDARLYGADWCGYTRKQLGDFGDGARYLDYVECTDDPEACKQAHIRGYPTWIIEGGTYPGYLQQSTLAKIIGCGQ